MQIRRLLLIALLLLNTEFVYGEWMLIEHDEQRGMSLYVDPETMNRRADMVEMSVLYDFNTPQTATGYTYSSRKVESVFDCTAKNRRSLSVKEFSGNMGSGDVVYTYSYLFAKEPKWIPVRPGTVGETLRNVACSKK